MTGAPLGHTLFGLPDETVPRKTIIRTDTDVPILVVQTETDLQTFRSTNARQPDAKRFRLWEIAGAAHADTYTGATGINDTGDGSAERAVLDPDRAHGWTFELCPTDQLGTGVRGAQCGDGTARSLGTRRHSPAEGTADQDHRHRSARGRRATSAATPWVGSAHRSSTCR